MERPCFRLWGACAGPDGCPYAASTGPVAEIGLRRLSIEAEPVGKSKRLPQVFRIGVSHERDKKAVQSMLDTLNCAYCMAARLLRLSLGRPRARPPSGKHASAAAPASAPGARQGGHEDASIRPVTAMHAMIPTRHAADFACSARSGVKAGTVRIWTVTGRVTCLPVATRPRFSLMTSIPETSSRSRGSCRTRPWPRESACTWPLARASCILPSAYFFSRHASSSSGLPNRSQIWRARSSGMRRWP